jgi:class 3 adenylate cyclase
VNPQQLKNALIKSEETERVERIILEAKLSPERLFAAVARVESCRGSERERFAARLLHDLLCYHRDMRSLETANAGFDSINLVSDNKVRELSAVNRMLYEFLPPEDQKPTEDKVVHHVVVKADIRDSSRLTRSLMEKGLNAASYFSLNFYDPINKMLAKYGATKVFLEGDAIIVALLERENEPMLGVARACVLSWEVVSLLREYNALLERTGLPQMEVGLGIAYQDSEPLYLMDGERRITISDAINESDRLSSCSKGVRKKLAKEVGVFQVYRFDVAGTQEAVDAGVEDLRLSYNVGGICLSEAAFAKLREEISLDPCFAGAAARNGEGWSNRWTDPKAEFFVGTVPITTGAFRKIVIRKSRVAQVDTRDLAIQQWTGRYYYEVCANAAVYAALPGEKSSAAKK